MQGEKFKELKISVQLNSSENGSSNSFQRKSEESGSLKLSWQEGKGHKDNPDNPDNEAPKDSAAHSQLRQPQSRHQRFSHDSLSMLMTGMKWGTIRRFFDNRMQDHENRMLEQQNRMLQEIRKLFQAWNNTFKIKEQRLNNNQSERQVFTKEEKMKLIKMIFEGVTAREVFQLANINQRTLRRLIQNIKYRRKKNAQKTD